jgi:hypothetical protein
LPGSFLDRIEQTQSRWSAVERAPMKTHLIYRHGGIREPYLSAAVGLERDRGERAQEDLVVVFQCTARIVWT